MPDERCDELREPLAEQALGIACEQRARARPHRPLRELPAPAEGVRVVVERSVEPRPAGHASGAAMRTSSWLTRHGVMAVRCRRRRDLADALRAGDITIEGDQHAVTRFLELFPPPQPAAAPA
jgi:hypothetical protein